MLCRTKYPYTAAYHVWKTRFPIYAERRFLMTVDEINEHALIETSYTGTTKNWYHDCVYGEIPIVRMAMIHSSGGVFGIHKPEKYSKDIYELIVSHLSNWEHATRGYVIKELDDELRREFAIFDSLAADVLEVAKWYGAKHHTFTDDKFMSAFRKMANSVGSVSGRVFTSEKIITDFKHGSFVDTFNRRGINNVL